MINSQNLGLVIQGPISSKSLNQKLNQKEFDTNQNIIKIVNSFSSLFKEITLSTWASEKSKISKKLLKNKKLKIIFLKDLGYNPGNELRHFYSSFCGVKNLSNRVKFVIKIRSDQFIDLRKSINFYKKEIIRKKKIKHSNFKLGLICTFGYWIERPYSFADFFYIGSKFDLLSFFKAQIKFKNHNFYIKKNILWPEGESVRKFIYFIRKKLTKFDEKFFFPLIFESFSMYQYRLPSVIVSNRNLILWQYVVRNFFTVLPDNIRRNMLWRGKKFRPIDKQSSFILWKKIENNYQNELKKQGSFKVKTKFFFDLPDFLLFSYYKNCNLKNKYYNKLLYINHLIYYSINFLCYIYLRLRNFTFKKIF